MKKILVSILAVFYLSSSVGAVIHLHYCMDKLINWSLLKGDGDKCDKCGMEKDGDCCKDEQKFVKNTVDQNIAESAVQSMQVLSTPALFAQIDTLGNCFPSLIERYSICHVPPLIRGREIYILNCVFRI